LERREITKEDLQKKRTCNKRLCFYAIPDTLKEKEDEESMKAGGKERES